MKTITIKTTTLCWNCNKEYHLEDLQCPKCKELNGNVHMSENNFKQILGRFKRDNKQQNN